MDDTRFDRLARLLAEGRGRRDLIRLLAGAGAALGVSPALARQDGADDATPDDAASGGAGAAARCGEKRDTCRRDSDCCSGLSCVDDRCKQDRADRCGKKGDRCNSSGDCCSGFRCSSGSCERDNNNGSCKGEGKSCEKNKDCCDDLRCNDGRCGTKSKVKFERAWGTAGSGDTQLQDPEGVSVDTEASGGDEVYVADTGNDRIQVFSDTGAPRRRWGSRGSGDDQFRSPADVGVNTRTGQVYVSDRENNRVVEYEFDGTFVRTTGSEGTGSERFRQPRGLAVLSGSTTRMFVADSGNDRIQELSGSRLGFDGSFGSLGTANGQFEGPNGVAVNSIYVVVADTFNDRVQIFNRSTLSHVRTIGSTAGGTGDGQFRAPRGVAIDDRNRIWVCDTDNNRVQVFDIDGSFQFAFGRRGSANEQFNVPRGITVVGNRDDGYRIYVADTGNDRIQKFTMSGNK